MGSPTKPYYRSALHDLPAADDCLGYIEWALPQTLIPLINSKLHTSLIPILDFSDARGQNNTVHFSDENDEEPPKQIPKKETEHAFFLDEILNPKEEEKLPDGPKILVDFSDPKLTFKELWTAYDHIFRYLKGHVENTSGAEKFFDWLDESVRRSKLESRVYLKLRDEIESKMREKFEWLSKKFKNARYRETVENHTEMQQVFASDFPVQPHSVAHLMGGMNIDPSRDFDYDHVTVMREAIRFGHFPAVMNSKHPVKIKAKIRRALHSLHRKRRKNAKNSTKMKPGREGTKKVTGKDAIYRISKDAMTAKTTSGLWFIKY